MSRRSTYAVARSLMAARDQARLLSRTGMPIPAAIQTQIRELGDDLTRRREQELRWKRVPSAAEIAAGLNSPTWMRAAA